MSYMQAPHTTAVPYQGRHTGVIRSWAGSRGVITPHHRPDGWRPVPFTIGDVIGGQPARDRTCAFSVRCDSDGEPRAVGVRVHGKRQ